MSFRLDEGNGGCIYRIGVEDDGCHSLLDYDACAETAKVLEYLARSLNSVVVVLYMMSSMARPLSPRAFREHLLTGHDPSTDAAHSAWAPYYGTTPPRTIGILDWPPARRFHAPRAPSDLP